MSNTTSQTSGGIQTLLLWVSSFVLPGTVFLFKGKHSITRFLGFVSVLAFLFTYSFVTYFLINYGLMDASMKVLADSFLMNLVLIFAIAISVSWGVVLLGSTAYLTVYHTRKRVSKWFMNVITVLLVSVTGVGAAYGVGVIKDVNETLNTVTETPEEEEPVAVTEPADPWGEAESVNMMILGSDAGKDRTGVRPDVLMVANINTTTGKTVLFNVPRNLTDAPFPEGSPAHDVFPSGYDGMVNEIWTWAENRPELWEEGSNPGLQATQSALEGVTGLPIDYNVVVDMEGFVDLVNTFGGVTVDVPRDLPIAKTNGPVTGWVKAGEDRTLDGQEALWFVRSRADSSDYDRMLRQRCMISALTQKITPQELVLRVPPLLDVLKDNVITNINRSDLQPWSELLNLVRSSTIEGVAFTDDVISPSNPDFTAIHSTVKESIKAANAAPTPPTTPSGGVEPSQAPTTPPASPEPSDGEFPDSYC